MARYRLATTFVLATVISTLPTGAAAIQSGAAVRTSPGLMVERSAEGLDSPCNAIVLPDGGLLVAEAQTERKNEDPSYRGQGRNRILQLRDTDGEGHGIAFGRSTVLPAHYREGTFVARHRSWNRSQLLGYDVGFVPFRDGRAMGPMEPVLTGFSDGPGHVLGRLCALAVARDGALLVVDDKGGTIWRIAVARRKH